MEIEETVEATEEAAEQVEETEESTPSEETEHGEDAAADPEEQEDKPKSKGVQKRIDELVRQREEERRRAERLEERLHEMYSQKPKPEEAPKADPKPTLEQFQYDDEKYQDALVDWKVRQHLRQQEAQAHQQRQREQLERIQQEGQRKAAEVYRKGSEEDPHFQYEVDEAVRRGFIAPHMIEAIVESDIGHKVALHLARNPEEAAKIAQLPPVRQVKEIAKLEVTLSTPQPKKTTKAPPPPSHIRGNAAPVVDPDKLPYDEWLKGRESGKW